MDPFYSLGIAIVGAVVWGVRLEGRVNAAEQRHLDLKELINSQLGDINRRLSRIERSINGHFRPEEEP